MTKDDILELALEVEFGYCEEYIGNKSSPCRKEIVRFAALLEEKVRADERKALLTAIGKLRDESHTILGASDDYKQGREMGIQLCINELTRGEK